MTFDLLMDQGAYAEFKRHRMMSQTPQRLTCLNGYATPILLTKAGFETEYEQAMGAAQMFWNELAEWNVDVAQYVVPNAFNRRVLATFNLREAFSFCQLRTAANAHFSIRRIAQMMAVEVRRVYPALSKYMKISEEPWQQIEMDHFASV
jgi:thymidylate synthase ThyX